MNDLEVTNKKLMNELRNIHDDKLAMEKRLKQDISNQRSVLKELHERLEKYNETDNVDESGLSLRQQIMEKNSKINDLEKDLNTKLKLTENLKEEV
jgi:hypothetical protein